MIDPTEDDLSYFADWYLNSGDIKRLYTPFKNPLLFSLTNFSMYPCFSIY